MNTGRPPTCKRTNLALRIPTDIYLRAYRHAGQTQRGFLHLLCRALESWCELQPVVGPRAAIGVWAETCPVLNEELAASASDAGRDWALEILKETPAAGPWTLTGDDYHGACPVVVPHTGDQDGARRMASAWRRLVCRAAAARWAMEIGPGGRWM